MLILYQKRFYGRILDANRWSLANNIYIFSISTSLEAIPFVPKKTLKEALIFQNEHKMILQKPPLLIYSTWTYLFSFPS